MSNTSKNIVSIVKYGLVILALACVGATTYVISQGMGLYAISSGSMEPAISLGSVIVVQPQESYEIGDVVTFDSHDELNVTVTHRVVEIIASDPAKDVVYKTKGDANNSPDSLQVAEKNILGRTLLVIPYLGYVTRWLGTWGGYILIILVPAGILITLEFNTIIKEWEKWKMSKKNKTKKTKNEHIVNSNLPAQAGQSMSRSPRPIDNLKASHIRANWQLHTSVCFGLDIHRLHHKTGIITAVVFMIGVLFFPTDVNANFINTEESQDNILTADSLYFSVKDELGTPVDLSVFAGSVLPGVANEKTIVLHEEGGMPFQYRVVASDLLGIGSICSSLNLTLSVDGTSAYSGSLLSVGTHTPVTVSGTNDQLDMEVSLSSNDASLRGGTCFFSLTINAWQTDSDGSWGFTDTEMFLNIIEAGNWPVAGEVVINEVMWMGSNVSTADEWLELKNMTTNPIDLSYSVIVNAGTIGVNITLPPGSIIDAGGYYLVSNYADTHSNSALAVTPQYVTATFSLNNSGEQLSLTNSFGAVIDQTPLALWPAGILSTEFHSMERNTTPSDGTVSTNWHSCIDAVCNDVTYWDVEGDNYGTPGGLNH